MPCTGQNLSCNTKKTTTNTMKPRHCLKREKTKRHKLEESVHVMLGLTRKHHNIFASWNKVKQLIICPI